MILVLAEAERSISFVMAGRRRGPRSGRIPCTKPERIARSAI